MVIKASQYIPNVEMKAENGEGKLELTRLLTGDNAPEKLRMYARAVLEPNASVGFHIHHGESESYYILSGKAEYIDDDKTYEVYEGDVTYTPDGHGHAIKNIGVDNLEFIALIIKD